MRWNLSERRARCGADTAEDVDAEVGADLGAELATGASRREQRIAIALGIHLERHLEHLGRADGDAERAALARLDVDRDGAVCGAHAAGCQASTASSTK